MMRISVYEVGKDVSTDFTADTYELSVDFLIIIRENYRFYYTMKSIDSFKIVKQDDSNKHQ